MIYEIRDYTYTQGYILLGTFPSFQKAKDELKKHISKGKPISPFISEIDGIYEKIRIVKIPFGWMTKEKVVYEIERIWEVSEGWMTTKEIKNDL